MNEDDAGQGIARLTALTLMLIFVSDFIKGLIKRGSKQAVNTFSDYSAECT